MCYPSGLLAPKADVTLATRTRRNPRSVIDSLQHNGPALRLPAVGSAMGGNPYRYLGATRILDREWASEGHRPTQLLAFREMIVGFMVMASRGTRQATPSRGWTTSSGTCGRDRMEDQGGNAAIPPFEA